MLREQEIENGNGYRKPSSWILEAGLAALAFFGGIYTNQKIFEVRFDAHIDEQRSQVAELCRRISALENWRFEVASQLGQRGQR